MKNNSKLAETLVRSVGMVLGSNVANHVKSQLDNHRLHIPSESVLSKSRLRVDVLISLMQRDRMQAPNQLFVYLSADSSPQGGMDYLMTLQDTCHRTFKMLQIFVRWYALRARIWFVFQVMIDDLICKQFDFGVVFTTDSFCFTRAGLN